MSFCKLNTLKSPSMLEQLIEEINFQRVKEMRQLVKDDSGFVMLQGSSYWTDLFVRHFLFQTEQSIDCDDLLFFVRKRHVKGSSRFLPKFQTEVDVFRKDSRRLPVGDPDIDWEETVYLNLIIHQFDYTLTLAVCTRTSPKELQVLKRHSQKVFASPSRRKMDTKGENEEMTYPYICFMVDNFNEVFCDIFVRDGEMVCVELVASDHDGNVQSVIFLGSIRYDALKKVYDARMSLSSKMAQRMTFGLFTSSSQRVEFVRMKGPEGKGHAEMAVTKPKGCGAETPTSEPGYCATDLWDIDWEEDPDQFQTYKFQRRLSDPSANLDTFMRGSWRPKENSAGSRARSENEGLDSLANGLTEIEAGDVRDDLLACFFKKHYNSGTPSQYQHLQNLSNDMKALANKHSEIKFNKDISENSGQSDSNTLHEKRDSHFNAGEVLKSPIQPENSPEKITPCHSSGNSELVTSDNTQSVANSSSSNGCDDSDEEFFDCKTWDEEGLTKIYHENYSSQEPSCNYSLSSIGTSSTCDSNQANLDFDKKNKSSFKSETDTTQLFKSVFLYRKRAGLVALHQPSKKQPPKKTTPDGTVVSYWCDIPPKVQAVRSKSLELDDGAYNPLWTMRGFTQSFHFWKENKRAQSIPLNVFLTYITLPWWSIVNDILDHREGPILTF